MELHLREETAIIDFLASLLDMTGVSAVSSSLLSSNRSSKLRPTSRMNSSKLSLFCGLQYDSVFCKEESVISVRHSSRVLESIRGVSKLPSDSLIMIPSESLSLSSSLSSSRNLILNSMGVITARKGFVAQAQPLWLSLFSTQGIKNMMAHD